MKMRLWFVLGLALATLFGCKKSASPPGAAGSGGTGTVVGGTGVAGLATQGGSGMAAPGTGGASGQGAAGAAGPAPGTFGYLYTNVIVAVGCNGGTLCHATGTVSTLSMADKNTTYMGLVNMAAMGKNLVMGKGPDCKDSGLMRVVPGKPDESLLMLKVQGKPPCGDAMPPTSPLAADKVQMFRDWIMAGAKND